MAKQGGLGDRLLVGGYDLSGDIGSLGRIGGSIATLDVTGIDKSAMERIGGQRDGSIEFSAFYNPAANQAHPVLSALPTTDVTLTYLRGTALAGPAACLVGKQIDYAPTRANDGALTIAVSAQANGFGLEWGLSHTAGLRTDTAATNGTPVDWGALGTSNFGLQAYLQVTAFTGTDVTIKLQESSDNAGDAYADVVGGGFATVTTAPQTQRIATTAALAVERYLRVATTTSGGVTSVTFQVTVVRNYTAPAF
jgi:hypothetical protein